jgi:hypothetical protein
MPRQLVFAGIPVILPHTDFVADGRFDGFEDFHVPGAATDIARQRLADFRFVRPGVAPQQTLNRHDHARCAEAALRAKVFMKGALQAGQPAVLAQ